MEYGRRIQAQMGFPLNNKYLKGTPFMQGKLTTNCSWQWKGILNSRFIIKKGICTKIGSGRHTPIRDHPWIPSLDRFILIPNPAQPSYDIHWVSDLINPNSFQWDRNFPVFNSQTARKIRIIHISPTQSQDKFIWSQTVQENSKQNLHFSLSQTQLLILPAPSYQKIVILFGMQKYVLDSKWFFRKIAWDILPTKAILQLTLHPGTSPASSAKEKAR